MLVADVVTTATLHGTSGPEQARLAALLRQEGIDLSGIENPNMLRGTPVYVEADADLLEVQRKMARCHIRSTPVLRGDELIGFLDLVELAGRDDL